LAQAKGWAEIGPACIIILPAAINPCPPGPWG